MKRLIAANWKMTGNREEWLALAQAVQQKAPQLTQANFVLCPPFPALGLIDATHNVALGAQDVSVSEKGAFTGDVSASMLKSMGCDYVIVGHSERREGHAESNTMIHKKIQQLQANGLKPILCIGESLEERTNGTTNEVLTKQLRECLENISIDHAADLVIAYEPIWAISAAGVSRQVTKDEVEEALNHIHEVAKHLLQQKVQVLYGGSVNPESAEMLKSIDALGGVLVGSASLDAEKFYALAKVLTE